MSELAKTLANQIRAKSSTLVKSSLSMIEWGNAYVPHFFFRTGCSFHHDLGDTLDAMAIKRGQKVLVLAPRGNAKSTICSMTAPLKFVCEATEKYILIISDTADQAKKYLRSIADELLHNETLRKKYPLACQPAKDGAWNADRIETANGVCVEAIGKGAGVRGRKFKQYRPTLVILDDPQNDDDVISPSTRSRDIDWFDKALSSVGDTDTNFFVIGTNLHRESIVNILASRADYRTMRYASIITWPTNEPLWKEWETLYITGRGEEAQTYYIEHKSMLDEGASVLWPEKENLLQLMQLRATIGQVAFATEKQNEPRDPNKCEFDEAWFEGDDVWYSDLPTDPKVIPNGLIHVGYCDPAKGGETKRHDFPAIVNLHYSPDLGRCFISCDMNREPVNRRIDTIIRFIDLYKMVAFGVEANGFQQLMAEELTAKCPLAPIHQVNNNSVHKNTRISRLALWFQRRFFVYKKGCRHTKILLQQIFDHPNSDHDDGPDALEGAIRTLTEVCDLTLTINAETYVSPADDGLGDNIFSSFSL
jgi:hypothetical protein